MWSSDWAVLRVLECGLWHTRPVPSDFTRHWKVVWCHSQCLYLSASYLKHNYLVKLTTLTFKSQHKKMKRKIYISLLFALLVFSLTGFCRRWWKDDSTRVVNKIKLFVLSSDSALLYRKKPKIRQKMRRFILPVYLQDFETSAEPFGPFVFTFCFVESIDLFTCVHSYESLLRAATCMLCWQSDKAAWTAEGCLWLCE